MSEKKELVAVEVYKKRKNNTNVGLVRNKRGRSKEHQKRIKQKNNTMKPITVTLSQLGTRKKN